MVSSDTSGIVKLLTPSKDLQGNRFTAGCKSPGGEWYPGINPELVASVRQAHFRMCAYETGARGIIPELASKPYLGIFGCSSRFLAPEVSPGTKGMGGSNDIFGCQRISPEPLVSIGSRRSPGICRTFRSQAVRGEPKVSSRSGLPALNKGIFGC